MNRRRLVLAVGVLGAFLSLPGCRAKAPLDVVPKPAGTMELLRLFPSAGSMVDEGTVIVAVVRYEVRPFRHNLYYVMPQLITHDPSRTISGPLPVGDFPRLKAAAGDTTVSLPVAGVWKDRNVVKPLQVWFYLNRDDGGGRSSVIATIGPFSFPAGEGAQ